MSQFQSSAPLPSLRRELLGEQSCYVDWEGRPHCDHDHPHAPLDLQDAYEWEPGWTAQSG